MKMIMDMRPKMMMDMKMAKIIKVDTEMTMKRKRKRQ
jgi:hypothetical protein